MKNDDLISRAAAIELAERYGCNNGSAYGHHSGAADCVASEIATLPAVDAIPVEWLEAHRTEYFEDWGNESVTIEQALIMWQKEQEAMA